MEYIIKFNSKKGQFYLRRVIIRILGWKITSPVKFRMWDEYNEIPVESIRYFNTREAAFEAGEFLNNHKPLTIRNILLLPVFLPANYFAINTPHQGIVIDKGRFPSDLGGVATVQKLYIIKDNNGYVLGSYLHLIDYLT